MIAAVIKNKRRAFVHERTSEVLSQKVAAYLRQYGSHDKPIKKAYKEANKPLGIGFDTLKKVVNYDRHHVQKGTIEHLFIYFELQVDNDFYQNWGIYKHIENEK